MGYVPGVKFFLISQSPFQISLHYQDTLGSSLLNRRFLKCLELQMTYFQIFENFFRHSFLHDGGMFLEVKIFKNVNPKVVLDPCANFKIQHFHIKVNIVVK